MRTVDLYMIMVIAQNIMTTLQCPQNCTCDQFAISCSGTQNVSQMLDIPLDTVKLSLLNMGLSNDAELNLLLKDLKYLDVLDLSFNKFQTIPLQSIKNLHNLTKISLRKNKITKLELDLIDLSREKLLIQIDNNSLICNCETLYVLNQSRTKITGTCSSPSNIPLKNLTATYLGCDPCKDKDCLFGTCISQNILNATCKCTSLYTGRFCETFIVLERCEQNLCLNGGTCYKDIKKNSTCTCPLNASGEFCEHITDTKSNSNGILVGIIVAVIIIILAVLAVWYFVHLRPQRRRRRRHKRKRESSSKNGDIRGRNVQFACINEGYWKDKTKKKGKRKTEEGNDPHPHDPAHARWLSGRRRCSTILEEKGNCVDEGSLQDRIAV